VLIVTEPTVAGKHDMQRMAQLAAHFKIPTMLCVNKFDLNLDLTQAVENFAFKNDITCLGRIPFDPIFTKAMIQAQTVFEYDGQSNVGDAIRDTWQRLSEKL
jgi:MinD superfamily P-loop ATPase